MERELTLEEKNAFIESKLATPEGRHILAQTMLEPSGGGLVKSGCMLRSRVDASGRSKTPENPEAVPAISRKLAYQIKNGVPGYSYVSCAICGFKGKDLNTHINRFHKISTSEYRRMYPGRKIVCDELVERRKEGVSEKVKLFWNSEIGRQLLKEINEKRVRTNLKKYGIPFPNQKLAQEITRKLWKDEEWRKQTLAKMREGLMKKYGVSNAMDVPEIKEKDIEKHKKTIKEKYGVENLGQLAWVQIKARKSSEITPNRTERYLMQFLPDFVKYVGDGSFWIKFKDGTLKNPDFVVRPFRKWRSVIELFGSYFHKPEEEEELIKKYAEVGVRCLVIWDNELKNEKTRAVMKEKIIKFLTLSDKQESSETIRQTPDKGDDIVQNLALK